MTGSGKKHFLEPLKEAARAKNFETQNPANGLSDRTTLSTPNQTSSSGKMLQALQREKEKEAKLKASQAHLKSKEVHPRVAPPVIEERPAFLAESSLYRKNSHFDSKKERASHSEVSQSLKEIGIHVSPQPPSLQRRSSLAPLGIDIRARAVAEGLPPLMALATQISTRVMGNIVAYRGSGPIPPGLYHAIFTGKGFPKPVTEKAKSSTIGPQTGYAVLDRRNGRYELNKNGEYHNRKDDIPTHLDAHPLQMSLRNIFNDMGIKYALVAGENPDKNGVLRFFQIDHPYDKIKDIIYSVNLGEGKPIDPEILKNYKLISNQFEHLGKEPDNTSIFSKMGNLDVLCPVAARHPEDPKDSEPQPIMVLGGIVRDCDIDTITDPPPIFMEQMFGPEKTPGAFEAFLKPLDMSMHGSVDENGEEQAPPIEEVIRANNAMASMVQQLLEINSLKWAQYNNLKAEAKGKAERERPEEPFNSAQWSIDNADKKPFIRKNMTLELMTAMVVRVGKGTAMQLYQGLEINVIEQKIRASQLDPSKGVINIADFDSDDRAIRNAALLALHARKIPYNRETIATSFIQHPGECHNEHYTCPRGPLVVVSNKNVFIGDDQKLSNFVSANGQYQPINPEWIAPNSLGNKSASIWVKHFLAGYNQHYKNDPDVAAVKQNVDAYLIAHKEIFCDLLKDFMSHPEKKDVDSSRDYLKKFHKTLFNEAKMLVGSDFQVGLVDKTGGLSPVRR